MSIIEHKLGNKSSKRKTDQKKSMFAAEHATVKLCPFEGNKKNCVSGREKKHRSLLSGRKYRPGNILVKK